jgi:thioredoxin-related protein
VKADIHQDLDCGLRFKQVILELKWDEKFKAIGEFHSPVSSELHLRLTLFRKKFQFCFRMKNLLVLLVFVLGTLQLSSKLPSKAPADEKLVWYTDLMKAQEASKKSKKPIFGFFTGSDWCGWCHKLQRDVFVKTSFIDWAQKNVILLELDFPRSKQLPPELAQQNYNLQQQFKVQGYPTIWLFYANVDGDKKVSLNALGSLGYPSGAEKGKEEVKFLSEANAILATQKK